MVSYMCMQEDKKEKNIVYYVSGVSAPALHSTQVELNRMTRRRRHSTRPWTISDVQKKKKTDGERKWRFSKHISKWKLIPPHFESGKRENFQRPCLVSFVSLSHSHHRAEKKGSLRRIVLVVNRWKLNIHRPNSAETRRDETHEEESSAHRAKEK